MGCVKIPAGQKFYVGGSKLGRPLKERYGRIDRDIRYSAWPDHNLSALRSGFVDIAPCLECPGSGYYDLLSTIDRDLFCTSTRRTYWRQVAYEWSDMAWILPCAQLRQHGLYAKQTTYAFLFSNNDWAPSVWFTGFLESTSPFIPAIGSVVTALKLCRIHAGVFCLNWVAIGSIYQQREGHGTSHK